ncbi:MAG: NUDIX hydrolase [Desulfosarcina sp.]|nr:NUDIX hydrolase [Desulfosarcina sp.]MBC2744383.1 NUDIX hydrolase [Desulfosarcina sp.]MBC2767291.1 NUDIX hydrolase [Desulfosarcina sp.]
MAEPYRNPLPTVDIIIEVKGGIVLIERKNPPHGWAIPGGFVDYGESVENGAVREAREETGLNVRLKDLLYVYSRPDRDPRHHTLTTVFVATADGMPVAADDAINAGVFSAKTLPVPLVFDHADILVDYFQYRDGVERKKIFKKYY